MSDNDDEQREPSHVRVPLKDFHRSWLEVNYPFQRAVTHQIRAAAEEGLRYRRYLRGEIDPTQYLDSQAAASHTSDGSELTFDDEWRSIDTTRNDDSAKEHRVKLSADFLAELEEEYSVHTHTSHRIAAALDDAMLWRELLRRRASSQSETSVDRSLDVTVRQEFVVDDTGTEPEPEPESEPDTPSHSDSD